MTSVRAQIQHFDGVQLAVEFEVRSPAGIVLPLQTPERTDGLWATTCVEVFLKADDGEAYYEVNCSPSGAWAAYAFSEYRKGMRELEMAFDPEIFWSSAGDYYWVNSELAVPQFGRRAARMGLCAVLEEMDGTKSYWALAHPPGAPDFHHPACFALELPAAESP